MQPAISVLGMGRMGSALAMALVEAGHETIVWNRTPEKCQPLGDAGAKVAASVLDGVEQSGLVIVNVSDYSATKQLLRNDDVSAALAGKTLLELTSGTPDGARDMADWARERNIRYLDGAILATPDFIGTETGTILVSGPAETFEDCTAAIRALGHVQFLGEDPGLANALDAAVLSLMWGALFGALQSIAVCKAESIAIPELEKQWAVSAPVIQGLVTDVLARSAAGRFSADSDTLATVAPHFSAFGHLRELVQARGIDPAITDAYEVIFQRAIAAGHLHDDFAAVSQFLVR